MGVAVALTTGRFARPFDQTERACALRGDDRGRKQDWPVPAVFDASLLAILANKLEEAGRDDDALAAVDEALGELPDDAELIGLERSLLSGEEPGLDL